MTQQAQAEALQDMKRRAMGEPDSHGAVGPTWAKPSEVIELIEMVERLHARVQELTGKAAKYDHLQPYLCKTCGGYGLVDRRTHDDPLGAEPCPDCNAPTPPAQERKPSTDAEIFVSMEAKHYGPLDTKRLDFMAGWREGECVHGIGGANV